MCGLTGHGMNRDVTTGWRMQAFGRAVWWTRVISRGFLLAGMLGAGVSHAQQAPGSLPEVSLAAGPVTATLNTAVRATDTVMPLTLGGTATYSEDYTVTPGRSLTIEAGQRRGTLMLTLTPVNDADVEEPETVIIDANVNVAGLEVEPVGVVIIDDEAPPAVTLVLSPESIRESDDPNTVGDQHVSTATAANSQEGVTDPADKRLTITDDEASGDNDDDGLIEVLNLAQLHAIRFDLDGDGDADAQYNQEAYDLAFPNAPSGMGCPDTGCTGYELTADLDFDGTEWSRSYGWLPIGTRANKFTATFHGNGHTISNLFIRLIDTLHVGLFGYSEGVIRNVGLERVNIHGGNWVGGLVGHNKGTVSASYVTGRVASRGAGGEYAGGLAGSNGGTIRTSYARASVGLDITSNAGGLVGRNDYDGTVLASYAAGSVNATRNAGGLVGWNKGPVKISYTNSRVWNNGNSGGKRAGGFFAGHSAPRTGVTFNNNYWHKRAGLTKDGLGDGYTGTTVAGQISSKTATELKSPTGTGSGIYQTWNDEDVTGDGVADNPWNFGTSARYPVLRVDFDGDGAVSWREFGEQRRDEAIAREWLADHPSSNDVSETWIDFLWAREDGRRAILPDFSHAGYKYFEEEVPDVRGRIFDVTDYGAVPDDNRSDKRAIKAAINAAERNGSGIVFFPPGEFLVNTDEDDLADPISETNSSITIDTSNIVLRGSGSREGGTVIRQVNEMPEVIPGSKWTPPYMFVFKAANWPAQAGMGGSVNDPAKEIGMGAELTSITADVPRGSFWIEVAHASRLSVGQRIGLFMENTGAVGEFLAPYSAKNSWTMLRRDGVVITEKHSIAEIQGKRVRLNEPVHALKLKASHNVQVRASVPLIQESGVEDISFHGSFLEDFVHHQDGRHNSGWSSLHLRGCANCWVRRVSFVNVNRAFKIEDSAAVSAYQITIAGNPTHSGPRNRKNYGNWYGLIEDLAGQRHGMNTMTNTTGTVYWRAEHAANQPFDLHAFQPYASLFDCVNRGRISNLGGSRRHYPNHFRHAVFWNLNHDVTGSSSTNYDFWSSTNSFSYSEILMPIIVGLHGDPATFSTGKLEVLESNGSAVNPECLFEAQLETRLGTVPAWLDGLRTEWTRLRATPVPVPTVLAVGNISDRALRRGRSDSIKITNKFKVLHNRSVTFYSVSSSDETVVTARRSGSEDVKITAVATGNAVVTVTATSSAGDTADWKFKVSVTTSG